MAFQPVTQRARGAVSCPGFCVFGVEGRRRPARDKLHNQTQPQRNRDRSNLAFDIQLLVNITEVCPDCG